MIGKLRRQFEQVRIKKLHKFADFDPIVRKALREYPQLFPQQRINTDGSRVVYHLNVNRLEPISLEKEHGSREYIPKHYAKLAMLRIDEMLAYIEAAVPNQDREDEDDGSNEGENKEGPNSSS